jgi:PhoH-like ATPase
MMRVKCDAIGLPCEDYNAGQVVSKLDEIYSGFSRLLVDEQCIEQFYEGKDIFIGKEHPAVYPNEFVMLVANTNEKKTALARFSGYEMPLKRINGTFNKKGIWGIKPKNKEQSFAADLLMDDQIPIVSLIGKAGSGKTLLALASGLAQVLEPNHTKYRRLVVSRPVQPVGKDIGYLPGSLEEKMLPWIAPIQDNLQFLMGNDKETVKMYIDNGTIEIEALSYIRGRSISNAFIIIDEAQNLTTHELKTIVTRVGEGTKIILTGDVEQIDNVYIDSTTNGLTYAIEKFKKFALAGHVALVKGERSRVATLAAEIL